MDTEYKSLLFNPNVSLNELAYRIATPQKLYKYQSFYTVDGTKNPYWPENMTGTFHLSLAKDFEDNNDCKPFINIDKVLDHIKTILCESPSGYAQIQAAINEAKQYITEDLITNIIDNFQSQIRIGCFTTSLGNTNMWNKYSDSSRGYCIEYDTALNDLFLSSTLPVLYSDHPYDSSLIFADFLILELLRKGKNRTKENQYDRFNGEYSKLCKATYVPLFVKQEELWAFEQEYRMFILKHRTLPSGKALKQKDILDDSGNLNLSNAITGIYLGNRFKDNPDAERIYSQIQSIQKRKKIPVHLL